jgi:hypothetical protein
LNALVPTKTWSRRGSEIASGLPAVSTLVVLSSSVQVAPPSSERRMPTPDELVSPSPVAAKTIDWLGSLLRGETAMAPMLREKVGPKSVRGT